jgi:cytochrome b561
MHDHARYPQPPNRYSAGAIVLHWLIAGLLFGQIAFGWFLESIPRGAPLRGFYVNLHKSTGLTLAVLIVVRIIWRLRHPAPPLPSFMPAWERAVARWSHWALYACMLVMPLSGYVASNFSKYGVKLFNVVMLPPWGMDNHRIYAVFNTTHVVTSYLFVMLIVVHLLAAIRHALRRDGVMARMWPRPSSG